jgi:hypothetical protein
MIRPMNQERATKCKIVGSFLRSPSSLLYWGPY